MRHQIGKILITPQDSIRKAMETITRAPRIGLPAGITLVADKKNRLVGTVTDGDIRKALVKGMALTAPVKNIMARNPIAVPEHLSTEEMIAMVIRKVRESGRIRDFKVDKIIVTDGRNQAVDIIEFYELWYKQEVRNRKFCIVGTGHVGLTFAVVLAESGYQVTGFDINEHVVGQIKKGRVPFYEKGIEPLLRLHLREGNIAFTTCLRKGQHDVYVVCVGTPVAEKNNQPIFDSIKMAAENVGQVLKKEDVVILRSTVSVGITRTVVSPILESKSGLTAGKDFYLVFACERAVEGNAIEETKDIPQIIGGINKKSTDEAIRLLRNVNSSIIGMGSAEEAEMVKLINNSFRDLSFAYSNKVALMCERLNLDAVKIIKAANEGYPRNPVPLPSPGVGGYCLKKDSFLMSNVARTIAIDPDIFIMSRKINNQMPFFVLSKTAGFIKSHYGNTGKVKIFILGFAFKGNPETSDIRGSVTSDIVRLLREEFGGRAQLWGYDPVVAKDRIEGLGVKYSSYKDGFKSAHCVLILNNNIEFGKIDIYAFLEMMKKPAFFFDGWHFFEPQEIKRIEGIAYQGLGGGF